MKIQQRKRPVVCIQLFMKFQLSVKVYRRRQHGKLWPLMLFSHCVTSEIQFLDCASLFQVFCINTSQNKQNLKAGKLKFPHCMLIQGEHHHIVMDFMWDLKHGEEKKRMCRAIWDTRQEDFLQCCYIASQGLLIILLLSLSILPSRQCFLVSGKCSVEKVRE